MTPCAIAIVGMGAALPGASSVEALWPIVAGGIDMAREVPQARWGLPHAVAYRAGAPSPDRVYATRACLLDDAFAPNLAGLDLDPSFVARLDPSVHVLVHAGAAAWAATVTESVDRRRVGVVLGNLMLPTDSAAALSEWVVGRALARTLGVPASSAPPSVWSRWVAGFPAGVLARALGLGGDRFTLDAACASSLYALHLAAGALRRGEADLMLTGGMSRPSSLYTQMGFSQLRALSPTGRCAPFDRAGDGLLVGEGAGVLALKRHADALRDGDRIWALLRGTGLSNDRDGNLLAPSSEGQLRAMVPAYAQAQWAAGDVDFIECHATGTPVGDAVELQSLAQLRGPSRTPAYLGAVKANVGHLLTGAGAAALIKTLLAMDRGVVPPVANFQAFSPKLDPEAAGVAIAERALPWPDRGRPRRAAVSGFGFGGTNAHILLEHPEGIEPERTVVAVPRAREAIAIVGMAAHVGPFGDLEQIRRRVLAGEAGPTPMAPKAAFAGLQPAPVGWFIDAVQVPLGVFRIPPNELAAMLPQQLLLLDLARQAAADVTRGLAEGSSTGVFVGAELDFGTTDFHLRWMVRRDAPQWIAALTDAQPVTDAAAQAWTCALCDAVAPPLDADRTMGGLASIAASRIARELRLGGSSYTLCSEDSSGLTAMIQAVHALRSGELDAAVVGAVDLGGDARARLGHAAVIAEDPRARPLDRNSAGIVPSEGAACLVLKRLADARKDGDRVYAVIAGVGTAAGGGAPESFPSAAAVARSLGLSLADASVRADAIGLVDTAASGVPSADAAELAGVALHVGPDTPRSATKADFGDAGAASGLLAVVATALRLHHRVLAPVRDLSDPFEAAGPPLRCVQPWLRDGDGPLRTAVVASRSITGHVAHAVLHEGDATPWTPPPKEALFAIEGASVDALVAGLQRLAAVLSDAGTHSVHAIARGWWREHGCDRDAKLGLGVVARDVAQARALAEAAARELSRTGEITATGVAFAARPLQGELAFVFPGSGSHFPGMGAAIGVDAPAALWTRAESSDRHRAQLRPALAYNATQAEMDADPRGLILAQVGLGTVSADALRRFGVQPHAVLGYSLGETAGLFALGAWTDRDAMLQRVEHSPLFATELTGPALAVARAWNLAEGTPVHWRIGVVQASRSAVDAALQGRARVYRLIVNTPDECVIGGDAAAVDALASALGVPLHPLPGVATVHCDVVSSVREAYRALHLLPTQAPPNVRFYSGAWGHAYPVTADSAADSVTDQAIVGIDFPRVVSQAYDDGVRIFVELGPGGSCTRMIEKILGDRPFAARSVCTASSEGRPAWLRTLAMLIAQRVPVDLGPLWDEPLLPRSAPPATVLTVPVGRAPIGPLPPPPGAVSTPPAADAAPIVPAGPAHDTAPPILGPAHATAAAHDAFLQVSASLAALSASQLHEQIRLVALGGTAPPASASHPVATQPPRTLDRAQCLAFAVGRIGDVLGPRYAEIDALPTRVRLPAAPLMLVDRILEIDAEPLSMTHGRVVTEHDVLPDAWYLDAGRIATCVAVEAGQADLFLSAYLGVDRVTRGVAKYRLLDATVTFHDRLPAVGTTIRYDIRIERFFQQGPTWLFRFEFDATVDGRPLMTMRDGCAGFFTEAELAAGRGVVQSRLSHARPRPVSTQAERPSFAPLQSRTLDAAQLDALRDGDLVGAFGDSFASLDLRRPLTLPGGRMRLVHRITELSPNGGAHGLGLVRGQADIHADDWFIACHFIDDPVMPGTLMYECCLHTLRVFLLALGWVGEADAVAFEPKLGVRSRLACRGQVLGSTRVVTYEVTMRQFGADPEPWVICDASMFADGKRIVDIEDMSAQLTGTDATRLSQRWRASSRPSYDRAALLAFSTGKPSEGFGVPYEVFDGPTRKIARLPGPPLMFMDRVGDVQGEPFVMKAGARCRAEVDHASWAWTLQANRQQDLAFAVLLEIALQPCGWIAAYVGSALTSAEDLHFRNLGGRATLHRRVDPDEPMLQTHAKLTSASASGGMVIQHYDFAVRTSAGALVYDGNTYFGFFSKAALAEQVGLRDVALGSVAPGEGAMRVPSVAPLPTDGFRMIDRVDVLTADRIVGSIDVDSSAWFFKAHFKDDPVWPGSLGLQAMLQLLQVYALHRWDLGAAARFATLPLGQSHGWTYRGQVIPSCRVVSVQASITAVDDAAHRVLADGVLSVDGRPIYSMKDLGVEVLP